MFQQMFKPQFSWKPLTIEEQIAQEEENESIYLEIKEKTAEHYLSQYIQEGILERVLESSNTFPSWS